MEDRELLELAAKAAGAKMTDYSDGSTDHWIIEHPRNRWISWSPLTDDGDALRLAIKLEIGVMSKVQRDSSERNISIAITPYEVSQERITEKHRGDPLQSTRRAIVRAAAEIGKAIP